MGCSTTGWIRLGRSPQPRIRLRILLWPSQSRTMEADSTRPLRRGPYLHRLSSLFILDFVFGFEAIAHRIYFWYRRHHARPDDRPHLEAPHKARNLAASLPARKSGYRSLQRYARFDALSRN